MTSPSTPTWSPRSTSRFQAPAPPRRPCRARASPAARRCRRAASRSTACRRSARARPGRSTADPLAGARCRLEVGVLRAQLGDRGACAGRSPGRGRRPRSRSRSSFSRRTRICSGSSSLVAAASAHRAPRSALREADRQSTARRQAVALVDQAQADQGEPRLVHVDRRRTRRAPAAPARRSRRPSRRRGRRRPSLGGHPVDEAVDLAGEAVEDARTAAPRRCSCR